MISLFSGLDKERFLGKRVGVLFGGTSDEREISLKTGRALADALRSFGHEVEEYELPNDFNRLRTERPAAVLIAMHGGAGENGTLQGWLETEGIPYTGSGVAASALAMDKHRSKEVLRACGLPVPDGWFLNPHQIRVLRDTFSSDIQAIVGHLATSYEWEDSFLPLVLKRNNSGSSFGVTLNRTTDDLCINLGNLFAEIDCNPTDGILIEKVVAGPEYSVGFFGADKALGAIQITPKEAFYDYKAKYQSSETTYTVVEDGELLETLTLLGRRAYEGLGLSGVARVDIIGNSSDLRILEANTIPGMTATSLVPKLAKKLGYDFPEFANLLICSATLHEGVKCRSISEK